MTRTAALACGLTLMVGGAAPAPVAAEPDTPRSLRMRDRIPAPAALHPRAGRTVAQTAPPAAPPAPSPADAAAPAAHPGAGAAPAAEPAPAADPAGAISDDEFTRIAEDQSKEEVIFVTGSTIGRRGLTTSAPLTILDREMLVSGGQSSV